MTAEDNRAVDRIHCVSAVLRQDILGGSGRVSEFFLLRICLSRVPPFGAGTLMLILVDALPLVGVRAFLPELCFHGAATKRGCAEIGV